MNSRDEKLLERLRELDACDAAIGHDEDGAEAGWLYELLEEYPGTPLAELWEEAVHSHLSDAWWLALRLGVVQCRTLVEVVRRALLYASHVCGAAGLDSKEMKAAAGAPFYDPELASKAVGGAMEAARAKRSPGAADFVIAADYVRTAIDMLYLVMGNAGRMERRALNRVACHGSSVADCVVQSAGHADRLGDELRIQSDILLSLWPEVERSFGFEEGNPSEGDGRELTGEVARADTRAHDEGQEPQQKRHPQGGQQQRADEGGAGLPEGPGRPDQAQRPVPAGHGSGLVGLKPLGDSEAREAFDERARLDYERAHGPES